MTDVSPSTYPAPCSQPIGCARDAALAFVDADRPLSCVFLTPSLPPSRTPSPASSPTPSHTSHYALPRAQAALARAAGASSLAPPRALVAPELVLAPPLCTSSALARAHVASLEPSGTCAATLRLPPTFARAVWRRRRLSPAPPSRSAAWRSRCLSRVPPALMQRRLAPAPPLCCPIRLYSCRLARAPPLSAPHPPSLVPSGAGAASRFPPTFSRQTALAQRPPTSLRVPPALTQRRRLLESHPPSCAKLPSRSPPAPPLLLLYDKECVTKKPKVEAPAYSHWSEDREGAWRGLAAIQQEAPIRPKERQAMIAQLVERDMTRIRNNDHHWEDSIDNGYQSQPVPFAQRHWKYIPPVLSPSKCSSPSDSGSDDPPKQWRAVRMYRGRAGVMRMDRRVHRSRVTLDDGDIIRPPRLFGQAPSEEEQAEVRELSDRIRGRCLFDSDDEPPVGPNGSEEENRTLLDEYDPKQVHHYFIAWFAVSQSWQGAEEDHEFVS
ncbi:hypothetical protein DENSPDRAFT_883732 [Dentipellis sp. KUC8613]|nr:hypothetical protein DENSPDRAFT_883732 [Dentipellis sp. KUC8613]